MNGYWKYQTRIGMAKIININGKWRAMIGDEDLGHYSTPQKALDDLAGGYTFSHSSCVDTSELGLPDELSEWVCVSGK